MGDRGHNRHGPKRWRPCPFHGGGALGPRLTKCGLGRGILPYQVASSSIQPFGYKAVGQILGGGCALFLWAEIGGCASLGERAGSPSNTMSPKPRPTSVPKWYPDTYAIDMGRKLGGCVLFWGGGAGSASNTMTSPRTRPTSVSSGILIHPTVRSQ